MPTDADNKTTSFEYDALSRLTGVLDALNQHYQFAYDAVGNRAQRTDYNNMTTGYTYDALNRLTTITYPDASTVNYGYDNLSQLTSAANINGTVSFVYDSLGRATSTTDVWGQVLNYTYDANDRRTKLSFGATTNATYVYDVMDRLTKITDSANLAVTYVYDPTSKLTSKTMPNGVAATYTYDGLDRLTRLKDAKGNTVIADNQYTYNTAGDITQNIDQSGTHGYGYDAIDRLTSATYTGTPNESYAYDGVSNRTSSHRSATYGYQPFNRLTNTVTASYIYDNNGNMISKTDATGTTQFVWDFENRLTQVVTPAAGSVTYKYDALGRRIQRTPSSGISTNFVYDGQDVVKDINSDSTTVEYLNGPGIDNKIRQKGSSTSTTYYFSQDHLGSTTALTGTTGKLVERITYDGYGNSAGSTRSRYGFTGRERDSLTGLLYYRARFYDPQVGRFISEDPIGFSGGINAYAYVENNPLRFTDPSGLCPQKTEDKKDPCAEKVLTYFNLRDDSRKLHPYINSRAAPDFLAALLEINQAIPGGIAFSRAFRTRAEQEVLYAGRFGNSNPVAVPGTSRHESGFAVDVSGIVVRTANGGYARDRNGNYIPTPLGNILIPIFARHGFEWGARFKDPPHFDADPTRYGYKSRAEAIAAASSYYANCIGGK